MSSTPTVISVIYDERNATPPRLICCVGYELNKWRAKKLVEYVLDLIPDFVLTEEEKRLVNPVRPYSTLAKSVTRFFDPENEAPRGEVGEALAHSLFATHFGSRQFVARMYYKMRSNDQVTGFDLVHLRIDKATNDIELWFGEAKIHKSLSGAIAATIQSLSDHIDAGFIEETKTLLAPKISPSDPDYERLSWIFHEDSTLDQIVDRMVVPVFIAANTKYQVEGELPTSYQDQVVSELDRISKAIVKKFGATLDLVFIYLPLNSKGIFDAAFAKKLQAFA